MKPYLSYDFSEFIEIIEKLRVKPTQRDLIELKKELNTFFKGSRCSQVLYTDNNDKFFFGMRVMPLFEGEDAIKIIASDDPFIITRYDLEIDSRLFDPRVNLTNGEIMAIILHEVGHVVKDATPIDDVRKNIDIYLSKTNTAIKVSDSIHYQEILAYGLKDAVYKVTSMFTNPDDEIEADEFVTAYGYGDELVSALNKIIRNGVYINKEVTNKMVVLSWVLRLYSDIKLKRIPALRTIKKSRELTGSKLEIRELDNVARRLVRIDDDALLEANVEEFKKKSIFSQLKYKGMRSLEDDYYEYVMRYRNIEDENEALILLRQINTRISIIDDYLNTENLTEPNVKRWAEMSEKFNKLRNDLSKKIVYRDNFYGAIVVNYPETK